MKCTIVGEGGYYLLWFLWSLFVSEVVFYFIYLLLRKVTERYRIFGFGLIILIGCAFGKCGFNAYKIGSSLYMSGFIYIGYLVKKHKHMDGTRISKTKSTVALLISVIGSAVYYIFFGFVLKADSNYSVDVIGNYVISLSGIYVVMTVSMLLQRFRVSRLLALIGKESLYFFPITGFVPDIFTYTIGQTTIVKVFARVIAFPISWIVSKMMNKITLSVRNGG